MHERSPRHRRVALIVADEASVALDLKGTLRALGFDICDVATDGEQAFWFAMGDRPDVVVMEVYFERGREGIEVAGRLRDLCDAPVVFVTGYSDQATIDRIHERLPGVPVVPKPVHRDRLADAVAEVVQQRRFGLLQEFGGAGDRDDDVWGLLTASQRSDPVMGKISRSQTWKILNGNRAGYCLHA